AFAGAAEALISQPTAIAKVPESERVDARRMAEDIAAAGTPARWMEGPDAIVALLVREARPGDVILAMSNGSFGGLHKKLLDPLDGTTNYAHGLPLFACTVAAEVSGELVAGCTVDPMRAETFRGHRGGGAFVGARRLSVSNATSLDEAVVCTGFPYGHRNHLPEMVAAFGRFTEL